MYRGSEPGSIGLGQSEQLDIEQSINERIGLAQREPVKQPELGNTMAGFMIDGAKEVERNLATLPTRVQKRVVRHAVRQAQGPLLKQAKINAVARVGGRMGALLAANIVRRAARRQKRGRYSIHVQIRSDVPEFTHPAKTGKETFIPAAIEYGHGMDKESAARPFLRPAADATKNETKRILARELRAGILREVIRARYA